MKELRIRYFIEKKMYVGYTIVCMFFFVLMMPLTMCIIIGLYMAPQGSIGILV